MGQRLLLPGVLLFLAATFSLVNGAQASTQTLFGLLPAVLLFFVPALTMRLWAEERKLGTIELLMTYPVRIPHLVLAKFGVVKPPVVQAVPPPVDDEDEAEEKRPRVKAAK